MTHRNSSPTSQLLIWPRRRRRPREETGYVLGWRMQTDHRETIVCAGVLAPSQSLDDYQQTLKELTDHLSTLKTNKCTCLVRSLEIVAYWTAKPRTPDRVNLPTITQHRRGYPWWHNSEETDDPHQQLVFYDQLSSENAYYAHMPPELESHQGSEWTTILQQLNHGPELLQIVASGQIPPHFQGETVAIPNESMSTTEDTPDESAWGQAAHRVYQAVVSQSMTLLHFQRLSRSSNSWLSGFAVARCWATFPTVDNLVDKSRTLDTCPNCNHQSPLPCREKMRQQQVTQWDSFVLATLDLLLGVLFALLLLYVGKSSSAQILRSYWSTARQWSLDWLLRSIAWLETFPIGFKLNVSLTQNMGHEIRNIMGFHRQWLEATVWSVDHGNATLFMLMAISGVCGWTSLLAVVIDLWRLENIHLVLLARSFRHLYQAELFLLSALFRLFRGKKRNVLRQRTDSMQYDAMQLLVGTIGFCICIFLWTTLMVYYTFFVACNLLFHLPTVVLLTLFIVGHRIPLGSLTWRILHPDWFPKSLHFRGMNPDRKPGDVHVTKLCTVPQSPVTIVLGPLQGPLRVLFLWTLNAWLELLIPRSSNVSPCSVPLLSIAEALTETH